MYCLFAQSFKGVSDPKRVKHRSFPRSRVPQWGLQLYSSTAYLHLEEYLCRALLLLWWDLGSLQDPRIFLLDLENLSIEFLGSVWGFAVPMESWSLFSEVLESHSEVLWSSMV